MKIITRAPIEVQSSADAIKAPLDSTKSPGKLKAFLQKEKDKIVAGHDKRVVARAARKAKRNARPLTKTGQWFHDHLPHLKKNADGSATKTLPDGSTTPVPPSDIAQWPSLIGQPPVLYDVHDANGKTLAVENVNGTPTAIAKYSAGEVVQATAPDGSVQVYKADDTVDADAPDKDVDDKGLSENMKTGLIIGGAALVILGVVILIKRGK